MQTLPVIQGLTESGPKMAPVELSSTHIFFILIQTVPRALEMPSFTMSLSGTSILVLLLRMLLSCKILPTNPRNELLSYLLHHTFHVSTPTAQTHQLERLLLPLIPPTDLWELTGLCCEWSLQLRSQKAQGLILHVFTYYLNSRTSASLCHRIDWELVIKQMDKCSVQSDRAKMSLIIIIPVICIHPFFCLLA